MALQSNDVYTIFVRATSLLICFTIAKFLYSGDIWRLSYHLRFDVANVKQPLLQHSSLWGHLLVLGSYAKAYPSDITSHRLSIWLVEEWQTLFPGEAQCPTLAYLDLWPVANPMIFSLHPKISAQFTQTRSLPKDVTEKDFIRPLTQNRDMVSSDGEQWRQWRSVFSPGFSPRNIMALVPSMMEHMDTFINILDSFAGTNDQPGQMIQLEKLTTNLTFEIIGKAMLGLRLNEQSGSNSALKIAMADMTHQMGIRPSLSRTVGMINPWSRLKRNNRIMKDVLMPPILRCLSSVEDVKGPKNIMQAAAQLIRKEGKEDRDLEKDPQFLDSILQNLKIFLFAGHDTTATTICWTFSLLEENPEALAKLRREHDEQLGTNPENARKLILESPHILNSLPYTLACIKETLRLYTPVGTARAGQPDFFLVDPDTSMRYPTENFGVGDGTSSSHYREDVWPRPRDFIPERWLAKSDDPLFPMKDAWRSFQKGPRDCIGKELALVEIKLVLVLVVRKFDIHQDWAEWDRLRGVKGPQVMVDGKRLYMVGDSTGHTKDGSPVRITRRKADAAR